MSIILPLADVAAHLPPRGALIGLDLGTKTIGVAASDPDRKLATGVETIARKTFSTDAKRLLALAAEREVVGPVWIQIGAIVAIADVPISGRIGVAIAVGRRRLIRIRVIGVTGGICVTGSVAIGVARVTVVAVIAAVVGRAGDRRARYRAYTESDRRRVTAIASL